MIYLDHNATTPVLPEVFEAMRPYFCDEWGNPSSAYRFGSKVKTFIGSAREQVAGLIGVLPEEILFTSCATESNNAAIQAVLKSNPAKRHIVTSAVEHSSVLNHCQALEKEGYRVTYLPVTRDGLLNMSDLKNALTNQTAVVSLMWANNETGVVFPVQEIAERCRERGVLFHCDAVQAAGKIEINVRQTPVDYLSLSGTNFMRQRVWVLFTFGGIRPLFPFFTADIRKTDCAVEQRMFLSSSDWVKPPNLPPSVCKTLTPKCAHCETVWKRASSPKFQTQKLMDTQVRG